MTFIEGIELLERIDHAVKKLEEKQLVIEEELENKEWNGGLIICMDKDHILNSTSVLLRKEEAAKVLGTKSPLSLYDYLEDFRKAVRRHDILQRRLELRDARKELSNFLSTCYSEEWNIYNLKPSEEDLKGYNDLLKINSVYYDPNPEE